MRSRILLILTFVLALGVTFLFRKPHETETGGVWRLDRDLARLEEFTDSLNTVLADTIDIRTATVEEGGTLGGLLYSTGIEGSRYLSCCDVFIDSLGWTSVHVGDTLEAFYVRDTLMQVRARPRNRRGYFCIEFQGHASAVDWFWVPEEQYTRLRPVQLVVSSSVWESIAGGAVPEDLAPNNRIVTPRDSIRRVSYIKELENQLANRLFVYDIDFYYDVQPGDSIWLLIEEIRYPGSGETSFRRILAAKYDFALGGMTEAIPYFHTPDSLAPEQSAVILDHYHRDGASLRTMFLKMPVPFGRISSPFSDARMHPVLGYTRAHRGIDYASPLGTEIYAVGDGVITVRAYTGGYGNLVRIRHANGYETGYGHMSAYASGQEVGSYVRQGEVIGYVGSTGLSTGPHVHFEMKKNGSFVNPAAEILPPANPLEDRDLAEFMEQLPILENSWSRMLGRSVPVPDPEPADSDSTSA